MLSQTPHWSLRMAKLFSFNRVTLNGLFQGPDPWSLDRHGR
jgi:hypothetical protein